MPVRIGLKRIVNCIRSGHQAEREVHPYSLAWSELRVAMRNINPK